MEYKVTEPNEDPKLCTIEKAGVLVHFCLKDVEEHIAQLEKVRKEIQAKKEHEAAKMVNIESYHPFVLDMSEQDLSTASLYYSARSLVGVAEAKIEEIDQQLKDYSEEMQEIYKQIPQLIPAAPEVAETPDVDNSENKVNG